MMMTSSNGNIFRVTGLCEGNSPVTGEFPSQRPVTRSFDVFFNLRLNKRLSKQMGRRWFETPSGSLWRHCNVNVDVMKVWKESMGFMCQRWLMVSVWFCCVCSIHRLEEFCWIPKMAVKLLQVSRPDTALIIEWYVFSFKCMWLIGNSTWFIRCHNKKGLRRNIAIVQVMIVLR